MNYYIYEGTPMFHLCVVSGRACTTAPQSYTGCSTHG